MLQKPCSKSKARDHVKYLASRLEKWKSGDLPGLLAEAREIPKRLTSRKQQLKEESSRKAFCRLMLLGKIKQAMKFIDSDSNITGVHRPTEQIQQIL